MTAKAGGGQSGAGATHCAGILVVDTVALAGDSITLGPARPNRTIRVVNDGDSAMDVFPYPGNDLGQGKNVAVSLAAGEKATFVGLDKLRFKRF